MMEMENWCWAVVIRFFDLFPIHTDLRFFANMCCMNSATYQTCETHLLMSVIHSVGDNNWARALTLQCECDFAVAMIIASL